MPGKLCRIFLRYRELVSGASAAYFEQVVKTISKSFRPFRDEGFFCYREKTVM